MLLLVAAALPRLFWDAAPDTAPSLREAGVEQIAVPPARLDSWKSVTGISVEAADPQGAVKLTAPGVEYRANVATASRSPWINSNGWRFLRQPAGLFLYDVKGSQAAIAAAEAFSYGAHALVRCDDAGLKPLAEMLKFLATVPPDDLPPVTDIAYQDDGTPASGEVMNLMVKGNLLFRLVQTADRAAKLNVKLGTKDYPLEEAKNPGVMAHIIRANLTDDRRSLRLYGSVVVLGRVTGHAQRLRVQLVNYAGAERKVDGLRVRVLGKYANHRILAAGSPGEQLLDFTTEPDATEFTLPELKSYAVVELSK
jgi:hypothetical protein